VQSIFFAGIAALGNAFFVFGQKRTSISNNPFIFTRGVVIVCSFLFILAALFFRDQGDFDYLQIISPALSSVASDSSSLSLGFSFSTQGLVQPIMPSMP